MPPAEVYLLESGALVADTGTTEPVRTGFVGAELTIGARAYQTCVRALEPTRVFVLPAEDLVMLAASHVALKSLMYEAQRAISTTPVPAAASAAASAAADPGANPPAEKAALANTNPPVSKAAGSSAFIRQIVGWLCAIGLPLVVWQICVGAGLGKEAGYFLSVVTSAVAMWIFALVPPFVPALYSVLACILLDVAPAPVILAGFSSTGFYMLLSIFAIGTLMVMSGLTYRISLHIMKRVPPTALWYSISLFVYGLILTPIIPSQLGRTTIIAPFLSTLIETTGAKGRDPLVAHYIAAALAGIGLTASIFLTGQPANLIVYGLLDAQTQFAFGWIQWLTAAAVTGACLTGLYLAYALFQFRKIKRPGLSRNLIEGQLRTLGPMNGTERMALAGIALVVVGILTTSFHKVEIAWVTVAIMVALLLIGSIQRDDINKRIDWTTLILIASVVAWVPMMKVTGLDVLISKSFSWVGVYMKTELPLFILALGASITILRLALPANVVGILLFSIFLPLAEQAGFSTWLIGFIILSLSEIYFFPYQAPYNIQMENHLTGTGQDRLYDSKRLIQFNMVISLFRIGAILVSIPFWKYLNIL
jgi:DASS family divalent anion:Na+ symporter